jgi:hypothetical protein
VNAGNQAIANADAELEKPTIPGASAQSLESGAAPTFRSTVTGFVLPEVSGSERLTNTYRAASTAQVNRLAVNGQGIAMSASWLAPSITQLQTLRTNTEQASMLLSSPQALTSVTANLNAEQRTSAGAIGSVNTFSVLNTTLGANDSLLARFDAIGTMPVIQGTSAARTYTLRLQQGASARKFSGIGMQPYEQHQVVVSSWLNLSSAKIFLVVSGRNTSTRVIPLTASSSPVGVQTPSSRSQTPTLTIAPNPSNESATVAYTAETSGEVEITVRTVLGQTVMVMRQSVQSGLQSFTLQTGNMAQGAYFVSVKQDTSVLTTPLVIAR